MFMFEHWCQRVNDVTCSCLLTMIGGSSVCAMPSPSPPPLPKSPPSPKAKKSPKKSAGKIKGDGDWNKHRWGRKKLDTSYQDELRRQQLAEERRRKQQEMYDKLKAKRLNGNGPSEPHEPKFDDCKYLYCH